MGIRYSPFSDNYHIKRTSHTALPTVATVAFSFLTALAGTRFFRRGFRMRRLTGAGAFATGFAGVAAVVTGPAAPYFALDHLVDAFGRQFLQNVIQINHGHGIKR